MIFACIGSVEVHTSFSVQITYFICSKDLYIFIFALMAAIFNPRWPPLWNKNGRQYGKNENENSKKTSADKFHIFIKQTGWGLLTSGQKTWGHIRGGGAY